MSRILLLFVMFPTLLLDSCHYGVEQGIADINPYNEDSAMSHYLVNPQRSITLIDSAVLLDQLTPQRADYLKAVIEYSAQNDPMTAMWRCQRLIDAESWKSLPDSEDVVSFQVDVYRLMATICSSTGKYPQTIRYARQGAELAHGIEKLRGDEADFLSRLGLVLSQTGQYDEALEALRRSEALTMYDDTWSSLVSYFNNSKKLYLALDKAERYDEAKRVVFSSLSRLEALRENIGDVRFAPEGIAQDSAALEEFIQFFHAPFSCYLINIYANQQQNDSALFWLDRLRENPMSDNPSITKTLVHPLILLGRYDEAEERIDAIRGCYGNDTVNNEYLALKYQEWLLAFCRKEYHKASLLGHDLYSLNHQVNTVQLQLLLADAATEYHLMDEQQRRADAEEHLLWLINGIVSVLVLLFVVAAFFYIRRLLARQRMLKLQYEQAKRKLEFLSGESEETDPRQLDVSNEGIYRRALEIIDQQELYKDSKLDISMLSQLVMTNRSYLSKAINSQSGMNFRSWIAKYRIEQAKKLLLENPNLTGEQLAESCGFDNRISLYRQFKSIEGVSVSEWIAAQLSR